MLPVGQDFKNVSQIKSLVKDLSSRIGQRNLLDRPKNRCLFQRSFSQTSLQIYPGKNTNFLEFILKKLEQKDYQIAKMQIENQALRNQDQKELFVEDPIILKRQIQILYQQLFNKNVSSIHSNQYRQNSVAKSQKLKRKVEKLKNKLHQLKKEYAQSFCQQPDSQVENIILTLPQSKQTKILYKAQPQQNGQNLYILYQEIQTHKTSQKNQSKVQQNIIQISNLSLSQSPPQNLYRIKSLPTFSQNYPYSIQDLKNPITELNKSNKIKDFYKKKHDQIHQILSQNDYQSLFLQASSLLDQTLLFNQLKSASTAISQILSILQKPYQQQSQAVSQNSLQLVFGSILSSSINSENQEDHSQISQIDSPQDSPAFKSALERIASQSEDLKIKKEDIQGKIDILKQELGSQLIKWESQKQLIESDLKQLNRSDFGYTDELSSMRILLYAYKHRLNQLHQFFGRWKVSKQEDDENWVINEYVEELCDQIEENIELVLNREKKLILQLNPLMGVFQFQDQD